MHHAVVSRELSTEGSQPHIVARLVERAEASELQLAEAQQQLRALKQTASARAAAGEAGTSAAISAAQVRPHFQICHQLAHTVACAFCCCIGLNPTKGFMTVPSCMFKYRVVVAYLGSLCHLVTTAAVVSTCIG